jgi:hypothetical protein
VTACPSCKTAKHVTVEPVMVGYSVCCANCFDAELVGDPPEYVSRSPYGWGGTKDAALADWAEAVEARS